MNEKAIGFIDFGMMDKRMAQRLIGEGYRLVVYNWITEKAHDLIK
jgi:3-hydroxyisobutyrate dehydrogenase-like beta-hydroxyacid dehydrogenase